MKTLTLFAATMMIGFSQAQASYFDARACDSSVQAAAVQVPSQTFAQIQRVKASPAQGHGDAQLRQLQMDQEHAQSANGYDQAVDQNQNYQDKRSCFNTSDCLPYENCLRGQCVPQGGGGSCLGDVDCPIGERCVAGVCRR